MSAEIKTGKLRYFYGPDGDVVTIADLPPPRAKRWGSSSKAKVVLAVSTGMLSLEVACQRYELTNEEFESWKRALSKFGVLGLRSTGALGHGRAVKSEEVPRGDLPSSDQQRVSHVG